MVDSAGAWAWSSYRATAGLVSPPNWLEVHWTLAQFDPWDQLEAHRLDGLYGEFVAAGTGITRSPWEDLQSGLYLGTTRVRGETSRSGGTRGVLSRNTRGLVASPTRPALDELRSAVCSVCQVTPQQLQHSRREQARALLACLARDRAGTPLRDLTATLGVSYSGALETGPDRTADSQEPMG